MRTIRPLSLSVVALSFLLVSGAAAWAGKEDVSDGKTPAATKKPKVSPAASQKAAPAVPLANPEGRKTAKPKQPLICKPSETAAVNTLEDLYGANGGELTELLKQTLMRHQTTHGAPGTQTAQAAAEIQWQVTQPATSAQKTTAVKKPEKKTEKAQN